MPILLLVDMSMSLLFKEKEKRREALTFGSKIKKSEIVDDEALPLWYMENENNKNKHKNVRRG
jgi:hypothetical protein